MTTKEALIKSIPSAVLSFTACAIMMYFVIPVPDSVVAHAVGNGISGLISGFIASVIAFKQATKFMRTGGS